MTNCHINTYYYPFKEYQDMPYLGPEYECLKRDSLFGNLDAIKIAKLKGMDLHFQNDIIMKMAIVHGDIYFVKYLVDEGFELKDKYIQHAIFGSKLRSVKYILENKKIKLEMFMTHISSKKKIIDFVTDRLHDQCARVIQKGCENWLWKPVCKDGKIGIHPRILLNHVANLNKHSI